MADPSLPRDKLDPEAMKRQIQSQHRRVQGLRAQLYSQTDPSTGEALRQRLADEEATLRRLEDEAKDLPSPPSPEGHAPASAPWGRMLGPRTTGLRVERTLHMKPLPTGVYNLLDPETRSTPERGRHERVAGTETDLCAGIHRGTFGHGGAYRRDREGKADDFQTAAASAPRAGPNDHRGSARHAPRPRRGLGRQDRDPRDPLDRLPGPHVQLQRRAPTPSSNQIVDLSQYYGAWVTPYAETVQERVRHAADLVPDRQIWGYQRDPDSVTQQVDALYQSLKEAGITYINSVIDYGAPPEQATQRTRLPRESLSGRAANCIDGSVLFASLLEGSSLNAALVLVPGHAFVGWEVWDSSDDWKFLETTMIGSHDFEAACISGERQYEQAKLFDTPGSSCTDLAT